MLGTSRLKASFQFENDSYKILVIFVSRIAGILLLLTWIYRPAMKGKVSKSILGMKIFEVLDRSCYLHAEAKTSFSLGYARDKNAF